LTTPKYQYISDDLRERLATGNLPLQPEGPDGPFKLPGEKELAEEYLASRSTIRLALRTLVNQGLLETRHGIGTYVLERPAPVAVPLDQEEDWQADEHAEAAFKPDLDADDLRRAPRSSGVGSQPGSAQTTARFQAETVYADPDVAAMLGISEGDLVILRRSRQTIDGQPWCLVVSYYPMDIARGTELETARRLSTSSSRVLAGLSHEVVRYTDSISARMPDPIETGFFRSAAIVPVLIVSRTAHDRQRPVRLTRYIFSADKVRLVDERRAGSARRSSTALT
jgi:GntR family transcriptional regulator